MARLADVQYRIYADFVSIETGNRLGSSLFSISRDRFVSGSHISLSPVSIVGWSEKVQTYANVINGWSPRQAFF